MVLPKDQNKSTKGATAHLWCDTIRTGHAVEIVGTDGETVVNDWHDSQGARSIYYAARRVVRGFQSVQPSRVVTVRFYVSRGVFQPLHFATLHYKLKERQSSGRRLDLSDAVLRNRHTRTAKGMTRTAYRSGHNLSESGALALSVRGTCDALAYGFMFRTQRQPCGACGCKCRGPLALNDKGRARLARLRDRADARELARLVECGDIEECAACGRLSAYAWQDVERLEARGVAHIGAASGFEWQCGHCSASNVPQDSPLLAEVYTHTAPEDHDEREDH